jgi:hypothetical protein
MDICMLTPSQRTKIQDRIVQYEHVRLRLLACLDLIKGEWVKEVENEPPDWFDREGMVLPMERLDKLTKLIEGLEERAMTCYDIDDIEAIRPDPPGGAYNVDNYTLKGQEREELVNLLEQFSQTHTKLVAFLKRVVTEWERIYVQEPDKCTDRNAGQEISRRQDGIERWLEDLELIEKMEITELEEFQKRLISIFMVALAGCLLYLGGQFVALSIYRRLFGILYRRVSPEYAEPVSFWVTTAICFGLTGYFLSLALR